LGRFVMKIIKTNGAKMLSILAIIALIAVIGFSFVTCSDDDSSSGGSSSGGGSWDSGKSLKGTSWEQRDTYGTPNSSYTSHDYTYTMTFTSEDMLTITAVGWFEIQKQHVSGYNVTYTYDRTTVNKTYNGSYTYWTSTKEGYMNSDFWSTNPWNFKILSDNRTMAGKLDTNQFTRK